MGAMPPEIAMLQKHVQDVTEVKVNDNLTVFRGKYAGKTVVFASAGVGPIFAATTATVLVVQFGVECIVFTGVAGGLRKGQAIGDIILATDCVNYDMDVTAFEPFPGCKFKRGQLPFVDWLEYPADPRLLELAQGAALPPAFASKGLTVRKGRVATGSIFVVAPAKRRLVEELSAAGLGEPEAVEMECAAVAQVCRSFNALPFLGLRALSDLVTGDANADFNAFTNEAADNLWPIVAHLIEKY